MSHTEVKIESDLKPFRFSKRWGRDSKIKKNKQRQKSIVGATWLKVCSMAANQRVDGTLIVHHI